MKCDYCQKEEATYHLCEECFNDLWLIEFWRDIMKSIPQKIKDIFEDIGYWVSDRFTHTCRYKLVDCVIENQGHVTTVVAWVYHCNCGREIIEYAVQQDR